MSLTLKTAGFIIFQVLLFSIIFYVIGAILGYFFADIPFKFIGYEPSFLEKIVYGGLAIMTLAWIILLGIFRGGPKENRIESPPAKPASYAKTESYYSKRKIWPRKETLKAKGKPLPKKQAKLKK